MDLLFILILVGLCSGRYLKIVNWERDVKEKEVPFVVSVQRFQHRINDFMHHCGGSVVSSTFILTAAHCVINVGKLMSSRNKYIVPEYRENFRIVAGAINLTKEAITQAQKRKARKVIIPEDIAFDRFTGQLRDDIALIEIYTRLVFNDYVAPARFISSYRAADTEALFTKYTTGRLANRCKLAGWGSQNITYNRWSQSWVAVNPSDQLRIFTVRILRHSVCDQLFCAVNRIHCGIHNFSWEGVFCAKGKKRYSDPCDGDSGSPIFCDSIVYGIHVFVEDEWGCGRGAPSGYISSITIYNFLVKEIYSRSKTAINVFQNTFIIPFILLTIKS